MTCTDLEFRASGITTYRTKTERSRRIFTEAGEDKYTYFGQS